MSSGARTLQATPAQLGITFRGRYDAQQAMTYTWYERLVPFSLLTERREIPHYSVTVDTAKAGEFATSLTQYNKAPVDAAVRLEGTRVVLTRQQAGYAYDAAETVKSIRRMTFTSALHVMLQPQTIQPAITNDAALQAARTLNERLQKPITVQAAGKAVTADPALLAAWIVLAPDASRQNLTLTYDKDKVRQWLAGFAPQVYEAGVARTVTLLDGVITGQSQAADGRALDVSATADAVIAAAMGNQQTVEGKLVPVATAAQTIRTYTRSSQGLQALLQYWDQSNAGTWGIMLKDFNGTVSAGINPDRQFTSASVYKIYMAYVVYEKVDDGEFGMGTATNNGNNVSGCIDLMIVRSDNSCAHALGDLAGWGANDGMLHAQGFSATSLSLGGMLTTARDSADFMMRLENGTLLSAGNRNALLGMMGRNIYRYAIPAGSPGIHSANKLGALGTFNHDVAIVYHPKGSYVLSVFSQGSNHGRIRELARQITAVMSQ